MTTTQTAANIHLARQFPLPTSQERQAVDALDGERLGRVHIERLILHGIDNRSELLQLVDEPAILTSESEMFFALYIEAAIQRADWRARFADPSGDVPTLCHALLEDAPESFVAASRRLAHRLYEQMRPRTIAPGDFVVIIYTRGDESRRHIAMLKLDPDQRLVRDFSMIGGSRRVTITSAGNLLPDTARLQKCALLTLPAPDNDVFHIMLLDTQAGPRADGVAAFFYRSFLAAELEPSPRRHTREFLRCCDGWLAEYRQALTPSDILRFYAARRTALESDTLDCAAFVLAALPEQSTCVADLLARLRARGLVGEGNEAICAIDHSVAAPLLSRVVFELDGGTRLIVPVERLDELVHFDPIRTAENKVRIVVESLTLREVSER